MKINEVTQSSDQQLFEQLNQHNHTGYATTDLVKVVRQHTLDQWSQSMTGDQLMDQLRTIANGS